MYVAACAVAIVVVICKEGCVLCTYHTKNCSCACTLSESMPFCFGSVVAGCWVRVRGFAHLIPLSLAGLLCDLLWSDPEEGQEGVCILLH